MRDKVNEDVEFVLKMLNDSSPDGDVIIKVLVGVLNLIKPIVSCVYPCVEVSEELVVFVVYVE